MKMSVVFEENGKVRKTTIKDEDSTFQAIVRHTKDDEFIQVKIFDSLNRLIYEEKEANGLKKIKRLGCVLDQIIRCLANEFYKRSPHINNPTINKESKK